jgi:hypothetical protein
MADDFRPTPRDELDALAAEAGGLAPEEAEQAADAGAHRDPLSGEVGAHPVGVAIGAAAGGVAIGAAVGTVAGPLGTAIGAAVGAIAGGMAGKGTAEMVDPTAEDAWWRRQYAERAYHPDHEHGWEQVGPAYRYGVHHYNRNVGRSFEEVEPEMAAGWESARGSSTLAWDVARTASRDAWNRARLRAEGRDEDEAAPPPAAA